MNVDPDPIPPIDPPAEESPPPPPQGPGLGPISGEEP